MIYMSDNDPTFSGESLIEAYGKRMWTEGYTAFKGQFKSQMEDAMNVNQTRTQ